ncbi:MAG: hypothetical protein K6G63_10025, partial [Eubacterium sp.]|nr:hypothetical protein [Eubacterium sp.]
IEVKCTNYNSTALVIAYSSKKDRSDEIEYYVQAEGKKVYTYDPLKKGNPRKRLEGKCKLYKNSPKKNWIKVKIPKLKSKKKYNIRLKFWSNPGPDADSKTGEGIWFGKKTIKIK